MSRPLRIFVLTPTLPRPDRSAGCRRLVAILSHFARAHAVDLFVANESTGADESDSVRSLQALGVTVVPTHRSGWLAGCLRRRKYDLGLIQYWYEAERYGAIFRTCQPWAALLVDSVDLHFAREEAAAELGLLPAEVVADNRARELTAYRSADGVVVASEDDRRRLAGIDGMPDATVVPIIVPVQARPPGARPPGVVFVGGFAHLPNADGVLWFARAIWPSVKARLPHATFTVVGADPPDDVLALSGTDGIVVTGYVPETTPYLQAAAVSVAPLRYGGGMKGKVSEAMAVGLPVVTTTAGAQGFGLTSGVHALVADAPAEFAAAAVRLLEDPAYARQIGESGCALVAGLCSPEVVGRHLDAMVARSTPVGRSRRSVRWELLSAWTAVKTFVHEAVRRPRRNGTVAIPGRCPIQASERTES